MPKKKKQFINKQNAAHFTLVHTSRDQEDDGEMAKHPMVLQPFLTLGQQKKGQYEISEKILTVAGAERDEFGNELYYSDEEPIEEDDDEEEFGIPIAGLPGKNKHFFNFFILTKLETTVLQKFKLQFYKKEISKFLKNKILKKCSKKQFFVFANFF